VTLPAISTALISGALLAFALSFDEVIVTTFTAGVQNTLPIWIFGNIRLGQQLPEVNVVVFLILLATIVRSRSPNASPASLESFVPSNRGGGLRHGHGDGRRSSSAASDRLPPRRDGWRC
jgi:ABC-type Fe3+ transport system permease subunit